MPNYDNWNFKERVRQTGAIKFKLVKDYHDNDLRGLGEHLDRRLYEIYYMALHGKVDESFHPKRRDRRSKHKIKETIQDANAIIEETFSNPTWASILLSAPIFLDEDALNPGFMRYQTLLELLAKRGDLERLTLIDKIVSRQSGQILRKSCGRNIFYDDNAVSLTRYDPNCALQNYRNALFSALHSAKLSTADWLLAKYLEGEITSPLVLHFIFYGPVDLSSLWLWLRGGPEMTEAKVLLSVSDITNREEQSFTQLMQMAYRNFPSMSVRWLREHIEASDFNALVKQPDVLLMFVLALFHTHWSDEEILTELKAYAEMNADTYEDVMCRAHQWLPVLLDRRPGLFKPLVSALSEEATAVLKQKARYDIDIRTKQMLECIVSSEKASVLNVVSYLDLFNQDEQQALIASNHFIAFRVAIAKQHIDIVKLLWARCHPDLRSAMFRASPAHLTPYENIISAYKLGAHDIVIFLLQVASDSALDELAKRLPRLYEQYSDYFTASTHPEPTCVAAAMNSSHEEVLVGSDDHAVLKDVGGNSSSVTLLVNQGIFSASKSTEDSLCSTQTFSSFAGLPLSRSSSDEFLGLSIGTATKNH